MLELEDVLSAIKDLRDDSNDVNYVIMHDPLEDEEWLKIGTGGYAEFNEEMDPTIVKVTKKNILLI